ncbi:MAG: phenylacetate--CoA ligase [Deltaproteobacteria bacterium]|nr:MAG: phenylacetate--CoA ligase [Deltaproteobacteria bacterium]
MMTEFWNEEIETLPREELFELQLERLQMTLNRAYTKVDFYRQRFEAIGLLPEEIKTMSDLGRLPLTTGADLAEHYPYGLFSVPLKSIVRLKFSAAPTGRPIVIGYTQRDAQNWLELMARHLTAVGIGVRDIVQVAFNYGLFTGAFTFNQAAELVGATLAPTSIASATIQLQIMRDFRTTVLATSPSFAVHIAETKERLGVDPEQIFLRIGLFGPEAVPSHVRQALEERLSLEAYGVYGVNEMVEPGVAAECKQKEGLHLAEDHFYAEIVDPHTCRTLAPGQEGELVITTLTNEGYPLIRFRTGDLTTLNLNPCPCGRTSMRMSSPLTRSDDLFMVRGIAVYPDQLARLVKEAAPEVVNYRTVVRKRDGLNDQLELQVAYPVNYVSDWYRTHALADNIRTHLRRAIGMGVKVKLMEESNLEGEKGSVVFED